MVRLPGYRVAQRRLYQLDHYKGHTASKLYSSGLRIDRLQDQAFKQIFLAMSLFTNLLRRVHQYHALPNSVACIAAVVVTHVMIGSAGAQDDSAATLEFVTAEDAAQLASLLTTGHNLSDGQSYWSCTTGSDTQPFWIRIFADETAFIAETPSRWRVLDSETAQFSTEKGQSIIKDVAFSDQRVPFDTFRSSEADGAVTLCNWQGKSRYSELSDLLEDEQTDALSAFVTAGSEQAWNCEVTSVEGYVSSEQFTFATGGDGVTSNSDMFWYFDEDSMLLLREPDSLRIVYDFRIDSMGGRFEGRERDSSLSCIQI